MVYTDAFPRRRGGGGGGVKDFCLSSHLCAFWEQLWSFSRYIIRAFSGWWSRMGRTSQCLTLTFKKVGQESVITDSHYHGFVSKLHSLHKSDTIAHHVHWALTYRRRDKFDNVLSMKSWEKYVKWFDSGLRLETGIFIVIMVIWSWTYPVTEKQSQLHQPRLWFITGGYLVKR